MSDLEFYLSYGSIGILAVAFFLVALLALVVILGEIDLRRINKIGHDIARQKREFRARAEKLKRNQK